MSALLRVFIKGCVFFYVRGHISNSKELICLVNKLKNINMYTEMVSTEQTTVEARCASTHKQDGLQNKSTR